MLARFLIFILKEYTFRTSPGFVYLIFTSEIIVYTLGFAITVSSISTEMDLLLSIVLISLAAYCYFQIRKYTKHSHKQILITVIAIVLCTTLILSIAWKLKMIYK